MTKRAAVWNIMLEHLPRNQWVSINEIFAVVESRSDLDTEDLEPNSFGIPKWRVTVRRALMEKKKAGSIQGRRKIERNYPRP